MSLSKNFSFALLILLLISVHHDFQAQALRIPGSANITCSAGRKVGATDIMLHWNAPGVKGREGKIWGTDLAYYGTMVLGFGSDVQSPWRAGADECTTISFSTNVMINGKTLQAGKYAFFIELGEKESTLIFNSNVKAWGTYFYDQSKDVMRVPVTQEKGQPAMKERLDYTFSNQKNNSVEVALEWEYWRIPFTVEVDLKNTVLAEIQSQMSGALGFDPPSLIAAANWCLQNEVNYDQALGWINSAVSPTLGGISSYRALSVKSGLLKKLNKEEEAVQVFQQAVDNANQFELHQYGRQLLSEKKIQEALKVFEKNYTKNKGAWPTPVGMMRAHSALGNISKALEFAKEAQKLAPDELNKKSLETAVKTLEAGKAL